MPCSPPRPRGGWSWYASRDGAGDAKYRLGKVERGPIRAVVVASGTLNAVTTVQVGSQVSGQILEIFADFNTQVKKDQVIARIDPQTFELRVNQSRADLDAAKGAVAVATAALAVQKAEVGRVKVNLAEAERDLNRKKMLVEKNFISPAELDKARTLFDSTREQLKSVEAQIQVNESQIGNAQATVKQREALLKQAQVDLERTIIRAPVNGTVILKNIDAGQTVAASLQAPVLFTIAQDLRDMQVEAAIDEADVGRLSVGQRANFTVDAFPRRNFDGRNPADPQIAGQRAERHQLHGGDLGCQSRPVAAAGHDRERARGGGQPRQRAQGRQRRAALPA